MVILQEQHVYFTGAVNKSSVSIIYILQEKCHLYFRNSIMCLFYRGSITVLKCLFCRSSTMSLQERYHMIILQDQYYVFVIQKHVYAFNFQEQYHFILQDHCHYLFSGAVSCSFYRSSDMLILQEHYGVFILQEQCVFILQEQSHFT